MHEFSRKVHTEDKTFMHNIKAGFFLFWYWYQNLIFHICLCLFLDVVVWSHREEVQLTVWWGNQSWNWWSPYQEQTQSFLLQAQWLKQLSVAVLSVILYSEQLTIVKARTCLMFFGFFFGYTT
jgi:hypothetical protein